MKDLLGLQVMVHPDLIQDPANMQGHMGTITYLVDEGRAAYVQFNNDAIDLYSTDALLMLIPPELAVDKLRADIDISDMDVTDVADILEMYLHHTSGRPGAQREALNWAMSHDKISKAIIFSVKDWIEFLKERFHFEQSPGRGR
ncbi:Uncharacterised protein [Sphingobacterium daejeonense]|nr:Uncharacterised protein [Sphingobacterium daejeonense]